MNYRKVKCFNARTGVEVGYLMTWDNDVALGTDEHRIAWCKWGRHDGDLHLIKDTEPQDRWIGLGTSSYACWGVTWVKAVLLNDDFTVALKESPQRMLYGPWPHGGADYACWSDDAGEANILRVELTDPCEWLRFIDGGLPIGDINLPGTHDSAAISAITTTPYACHKTSITEQLEGGIRLLDVRIKAKPDGAGNYQFATCHGSLGPNEYQTLPSLLDEVKVYLQHHRSEFVALSLKFDDWNGVAEADMPTALLALDTLLRNYAVYPRSPDLPILDKVRGKMWLMDRITPALPTAVKARIEADPAFHFGVPIAITDNTPGELVAPVQGRRTFAIYVQDKYRDLEIWDPAAEKMRLFCAACSQRPPGGILVNFASATQKVLFGTYIQDKLVKWIDAQRPATLGWALFDYETASSPSTFGEADCVELVISSNFKYAH